jgi:hypothetical protein
MAMGGVFFFQNLTLLIIECNNLSDTESLSSAYDVPFGVYRSITPASFNSAAFSHSIPHEKKPH